MGRNTPVHNLRGNETEWSPRVIIALDTETRNVAEDGDVQGLRVWVAAMVARPKGRTDRGSRVDARGSTIAELIITLDAWARKHDSVWLYCHNLSFDIAVTRLPLALHDAGWEITDFALDGRSPWIRVAKGRRHITMADSWSWLPKPLAAIAPEVGITKPPLPADDDSSAVWFARCQADVDILLEAMCQLADWWQSSGRGRWSVTGAASGWNAYRHIKTPFTVTIDPDRDATEFDRRAIYGGKRYVGKVGKLTPGGYLEVDFAKAYTVIARDMPLPVRRTRPFEAMATDDPRIDSDRWGIVAECVINTDRPNYPMRSDGRVWYPVGRFATVLASPDIIAARNAGHLESIGRGQTYRLAPHMSTWARWCLSVIDDDSGATPGVARIAARSWGRSVIGKWAQRGYERIELGASPVTGWGYQDAWIANEHARASIVDIAGRRFISYPSGSGENAFPAVLAFVESYVRVRLNRAIDAIGRDAFVQCDTDGMLVSAVDLIRRVRQRRTWLEAAADRTDPVTVIMRRVSELTAPLDMRVKATYSRVEIIGPQHMRLDGHARMAGVPASAADRGDGTVGVWLWPKLATQVASGDPRGFVRHYMVYRVPRNLASGWVDTAGRVWPVQFADDGDSGWRMVAWPNTDAARSGVDLAAEQNPAILAAATSRE